MRASLLCLLILSAVFFLQASLQKPCKYLFSSNTCYIPRPSDPPWCNYRDNITVKVKVKCTLVQALRLCTGRTAHRGSRGIALPFHDHGTRRRWGVSVTPRPLFSPGKNTVPIVQEAGWAPGPVWTGTENLAFTGIRSADLPARSQSLYRLSYAAHDNINL